MSSPTLQLLLGSDSTADAAGLMIGADDSELALLALYAWPCDEGPSVRANMISTLDGAATGADGRSGSINGPADLRVFTVLRALADVVLVGAGTVRAEGYRAPRTPSALVAGRRQRGQPDHPTLAVVTASGELPDALLDDDRTPLVFTTASAPGLEGLRRRLPDGDVIAHDDEVDLGQVIGTLADRGMLRVLSEGGPGLLGKLLSADVVDELCLTLSPALVGGPAPRVVAASEWLAPSLAAQPITLLHADGVLLGRWSLRRG